MGDFIHEHGTDAALKRVDTTIAEREAAKDRNAALAEKVTTRIMIKSESSKFDALFLKNS